MPPEHDLDPAVAARSSSRTWITGLVFVIASVNEGSHRVVPIAFAIEPADAPG